MREPWVGFDLDFTLAEYTGACSIDYIGSPVAKMVDKAKAFIAQGVEVRIVTARANSKQPEEMRNRAIKVIQEWCAQHLGITPVVTAEKDFDMVCLYDDLAVQVIPNKGITLEEVQASTENLFMDRNDKINAIRAAINKSDLTDSDKLKEVARIIEAIKI